MAVMKAQEIMQGVVDVMGARDRLLGTSQGQSKNKKELKQSWKLHLDSGEFLEESGQQSNIAGVQWRLSRGHWL